MNIVQNQDPPLSKKQYYIIQTILYNTDNINYLFYCCVYIRNINMTEEPEIYYNKNTGKETIEVPIMSKIIMTELLKTLTHPSITKDEAVIKICLSELSEEEKVIVAVNIGEYKERTKKQMWIYHKINNIKHKLDKHA